MKAGILTTYLLLTGCASGTEHDAVIDRATAACEGRVAQFEHESSTYRRRLKFTCPDTKELR